MNLYQEEILDHYKHPRNKGRLAHSTSSGEASNPLCGDRLGLDIVVKNGLVEEVGFWGEGCAISQAAMSMVSEQVIGQSVEDLKKLSKDDVLELLGVDVGPSRLKCALLCLSVIERV
jgi:nitrogen fixation NifU-like protein